jgi:hypothetical protein
MSVLGFGETNYRAIFGDCFFVSDYRIALYDRDLSMLLLKLL